jgi:hypothetical protein
MPPDQGPQRRASLLRRLLCLCAALLLLGLSWWLISGGIRNLAHARTFGQQAETAIQLASGGLAIAVVITRFWRQVARRPLRIAWAATLMGMAGLSALVWGPPQPHVALLFAVVALLIAWGLLWALGPPRGSLAGAARGAAVATPGSPLTEGHP